MLTRTLMVGGTYWDLQQRLLLRLPLLKCHRAANSLTCSKPSRSLSNSENSSRFLFNNQCHHHQDINSRRYLLYKRFKSNDSKTLDGKKQVILKNSSTPTSATTGTTKSKGSQSSSTSSTLATAKAKVLPADIKVEELPSEEIPKKTLSSVTEEHPDPNPSSPKSTRETKKFEINTPSGLLTITTTIEDSKINEVVLEKANPDGLIGKTKVVSSSRDGCGGANIVTTPSGSLSPNLIKAEENLEDDGGGVNKQMNLSDLTKEAVAKKLKKKLTTINASLDSSEPPSPSPPSSSTPPSKPSSPSKSDSTKNLKESLHPVEKVNPGITFAERKDEERATFKKKLLEKEKQKEKEKEKEEFPSSSSSTPSPSHSTTFTSPPDKFRKVEQVAAKVAAAVAAASSSASVTPVASPAPPAAPPSDAKPKPKRSRVDFNRSSLERNFVTPNRAMSDFLLKPSDLDSLPKIKRRSPYEQEPPITVYWRKDVEAKAIEVWGSRENLLKETLKREVERKKHQQNIFTVKRRLREYRREIGYRAKPLEDEALGLEGKSGRVVVIAIAINGLNFIFKVAAWLYSGSHSMFAEAIHSLADTTNQIILAYGIHKSVQIADSDHPYGYSNMRHVSSLISGVGIFCVGCGLSMYHGITGLINPVPLFDLFWPFCILGGSLVSEGATLLVALNKLKRSAKKDGISLKNYILSGKDPCVNVVLTEDAAAVTSVAVAATCMGLTTITGNPVFDAVGSLLVGSILGGVASFIIYTNSSALVGKSISEDLLEKINSELESDCMIRAIYDVKGIHMGNSLIRYKAELDFDGRELTRYYLEKQDVNELFKLVKSFQSVDELEQFLLTHGENIVDLMGGEIDRIELKLRSKFPEIRHCDLEVL